MGFFFSDKPKRVTKDEMKLITRRLYGKFDKHERAEFEKLFRADLHETGLEEGVSQSEFDATMTWLRGNMKKHDLEENDLELIEKHFTEHLKD